jgi:signal transduction histidine kinase
MSFRARFLLAAVPLALLPLVGFALLVRSELGGRMETQVREGAAETVTFIRADIDRRHAAVGERLEAIARLAAADNRLRAQLAGTADDRAYLLGWAADAMLSAGLDMLQLQDASGRILSSGHFRNAYDRLDRTTRDVLRDASAAPALVRARTADGSILALARDRPLTVAGRDFDLVGGIEIDRAFIESLARAPDLIVSLQWPGGSLRAGAEGAGGGAPLDNAEEAADVVLADEIALPFGDGVAGDVGAATFRIAYTNAPIAALRARLDRWLIVVTAATAVGALLLASWLAARVAQPLADLARTASRVDLERLDARFAARRTDEIGTLAGVLNAMTARLRDGAARLREAERRAAVGEIARQVNHDIKNGLVPIRNVVRHLGEVARDEPAALAGVLTERQGTLDSGIAYLESLAANYARLSPRADRQPCDLNAVVRDVLQHAGRDGGRAHALLDAGLPHVHGDPIALRRIIENLVVNAFESLPADGGTVTLSTRHVAADGTDAQHASPQEDRVLLEIADTGSGMTAEQLKRAFEDFYTTKERGTGLGLSIVRRLVADMGGSMRVESEPGRGTRFRIELVAAG